MPRFPLSRTARRRAIALLIASQIALAFWFDRAICARVTHELATLVPMVVAYAQLKLERRL